MAKSSALCCGCARLCIFLFLAFPSAAQIEATHAYQQIVCKRLALADAGIPVSIRHALNGQPQMRAQDAQQRLWQASFNGLVEVDLTGEKRIWTGENGLPILSLTGIALGPDGRLWLATRQGAVCFQPDAPAGQQWFYFWGKRYLSDNRVAQIVAEKDRAWVRTQSGVSCIEFAPFDLERKSALFVERLMARGSGKATQARTNWWDTSSPTRLPMTCSPRSRIGRLSGWLQAESPLIFSITGWSLWVSAAA